MAFSPTATAPVGPGVTPVPGIASDNPKGCAHPMPRPRAPPPPAGMCVCGAFPILQWGGNRMLQMATVDASQTAQLSPDRAARGQKRDAESQPEPAPEHGDAAAPVPIEVGSVDEAGDGTLEESDDDYVPECDSDDDDHSDAEGGSEGGDAEGAEEELTAPVEGNSLVDICQGNVLPPGKRTRRAPVRYVDELMQQADVRQLLLDDVPTDELQAALLDEDFEEDDESENDSEGSGEESGEDSDEEDELGE
jgi:hypothetical protein